MLPPDEEERIFEVRVTAARPGFCHVAAGCPWEGGTTQQDVEIPAAGEWKLDRLQEALLLESTARRGTEPRTAAATPDAATPLILQEVGKKLFNFLFARDIYSAFQENIRKAQGNPKNKNLRIRLDIQASELPQLPWEALHNGREFLAPSRKTPIVRGTKDDQDQPPANIPLCVLGMVPDVRGQGLPALNVEAEKANIKKALDPLVSENKAYLGWTSSGDTDELLDRLRDPPKNCSSWHVFHFSGHGGYDAQKSLGYIIVEPRLPAEGVIGNFKTVERLYADDLKADLDNCNDLRLVILNSCKGAAAAGGATYSSTAEHLVSDSFAAVIAMQFEISDQAAITFSTDLYRELANGKQIHEAVTIARLKLKQDGSPEWITPVLYMRTRNGTLFREAVSAT
jgi:hypothetical protein